MVYEGICLECGGCMFSPYVYGSNYRSCDTCGLIIWEDGTLDRSEMEEE